MDDLILNVFTPPTPAKKPNEIKKSVSDLLNFNLRQKVIFYKTFNFSVWNVIIIIKNVKK